MIVILLASQMSTADSFRSWKITNRSGGTGFALSSP